MNIPSSIDILHCVIEYLILFNAGQQTYAINCILNVQSEGKTWISLF